MRPRGPEVAIAKFLRDALAGNEMGVPKLEAMARSAGLLGENQRITHAKLFKTAKKTLGIRSRRAGFGARSHWLWQLPRQNKTSLKPEAGPEQRATPEPRFPIPTACGSRESLLSTIVIHPATSLGTAGASL